MAQQTSLLTFTGRCGDLIGYILNGKYFYRKMPEFVLQTANTIRASERFGLASKTAACIRRALVPGLDILRDSAHINRLNALLIPSGGRDLQKLKQFRFNSTTGTDQFLKTSWKDGVHIPAQQLPKLQQLEIKVIAARINFANMITEGTQEKKIYITTERIEKDILLPIDIPGSGTLIVTLQVRAMNKNTKHHMAADIIAIQPPVTLTVSKQDIVYPPIQNESAFIILHRNTPFIHKE